MLPLESIRSPKSSLKASATDSEGSLAFRTIAEQNFPAKQITNFHKTLVTADVLSSFQSWLPKGTTVIAEVGQSPIEMKSKLK